MEVVRVAVEGNGLCACFALVHDMQLFLVDVRSILNPETKFLSRRACSPE